MKVLSSDCFFMSGMESILSKIDKECVGVNIIFDSGLDNIYLIKAVAPFHTYNPVVSFLKCEKFIVRRDVYDKELKTILLKHNNPTTRLTNSEIKILRMIYRGLPPHRISKLLSRSDKTISAHKTRALRKLGVNSVASFYFTLDMWQDLFSTYLSFIQEFVITNESDKILNAPAIIENTRIYNCIS